ncbi:MAG: DUF5615 family PIN-like protein [Planctomycetaceae bacterium]
MKLKLDENLGHRGATLFRAAGHDVATVVEQNLTSTPDSDLLTICHSEEQALVTLDMDFSNPLVFEPDKFSGIAVLRLPARIVPDDLWAACRVLIAAMSKSDLQGKLWIVQRDRVREYRPEQRS